MAERRVPRRVFFGVWTAVATFDVLALLVLLVIGTHNASTAGTGVQDDGSFDRWLLDLWLLWGLVPAFVFTAAAGFASIEFKPEPRADA